MEGKLGFSFFYAIHDVTTFFLPELFPWKPPQPRPNLFNVYGPNPSMQSVGREAAFVESLAEFWLCRMGPLGARSAGRGASHPTAP